MGIEGIHGSDLDVSLSYLKWFQGILNTTYSTCHLFLKSMSQLLSECIIACLNVGG